MVDPWLILLNQMKILWLFSMMSASKFEQMWNMRLNTFFFPERTLILIYIPDFEHQENYCSPWVAEKILALGILTIITQKCMAWYILFP